MEFSLKNKLYYILAFIVIIAICIAIYFVIKNDNTNKNDYVADRTSTNVENNSNSENILDVEPNNSQNNDVSENITNENNINDEHIENNQNSADNQSNEMPTKVEEQLSTFSTKIYNKENARQNNISITCSTLNDTIVPNCSIFSFCDTVGPSTSNKGYQQADIFDKYGNKKKGLGGGNCQVSTTLYNAILNTPNLAIIERHEHSNKVPYIQTGKDAAVAYGSYDLKFRNDTGFDIIIRAENNADNVIITLYKIS